MKKRIQKSLCALLALFMLLSIVPIPSVSAAPAGDRLDGWNETIYDFLKASVADVASGQQASTQFSLRDTNGIMVWSKEELGVSTLVSNASITAEAQAALNTKFAEVVDLDAIMNSLLADCPYDLYWYDKVTGMLMSYSMSANANEMKITNITFKLAVSQEYSAGQYTVDTALTQSMAAVTDNAMAIVEEHANKSDWDKLVAYKDEICELVAYNHSAADNASTPYGNPWQLIYVFDKDPSTNVVCEGYAKAFKLLCDLSSFQGDVYCYTVSGTMQGGTGAGNHMWNVVDINGGRLMVDVTNCDAGTIGAPDQLFLTAGTKYGNAYGFPASNSIIYYTYDPDEYGLYTDGYLELTPVPEQVDPAYLTYEIVNGEAIITDCDESVAGNIEIPATLGGYPVTTIGELAFAHLTNPISVNTGNSVKTISNAAFLGCYGLQSITLGDNVQSVDENAFEACDNLQSFAVSANNANFSSVNGVLYNKNQTVLLCAPKTISGEFTVPAGVLTIGEYAFDGCMNLTNLIISDNVTTISDRAFNNCMNLSTVKLGNSVATIGNGAFLNCSRINKLVFPISVTDIMDYAFFRCPGLTEIHYIGTESQWIDVNIGGNNDPFNTATMHYESDGSAPADPWYLSYEIVDGGAIITDCDDSIEGNLELPATLGGYPITGIGDNAFRFCQITDITLPETLETIGNNAFGWTALRGIYIPAGVHTIGQVAFQGCSDFTGYTVSQDNPFFSSDNYGVLFNEPMTELISAPCALAGTYYVPDTVTTIPMGAFTDCEMLENLYIPQSTTNLAVSGGGFFRGCANLQGVWVDSNNPTYRNDEYGALLSKDNWYLYFVPNTLSDTYRVPDGVVYVDYAFDECAYLSGIYFPEGVRNIGADFSQCISLKRLYIPASLNSMNFRLYELYEYQADIYYAGTLEQWDSIYSLDSNMHPGNLNIMYNCDPAIWDLTFTIYDGGAYITDCDENATGIIIVPDTLNGYPVVGIEGWAFQDQDGITEIHLPDSVTYIGMNAFAYCDNLTTVTMGDNVTTIGSSAFTGCTSLSEIDIPDGITNIEDHTFDGCESLTNIVIPDGVAVIRDAAFARCYSLTNIEIPGSVSIIGDYAFTECTSLTNVVLPYGVTEIGRDAFKKCTSLQSISLPNSLGSIGMYAFKECNWLKSIVIPDSVAYVGAHAFEYCSNLKTAVIGSGLTHISNGMFWANVSLKEITIPATVTDIDLDVFHFCDNLTDVYYLGTEAQKQNIAIEDPVIAAATWHCNSCIGSADHSYDNGCDTECNVCFAQRAITHTFDNACDTTCNVCPFTRTTSHSWNSGVVTKKATCKETGVKTFTCSTCKGTKTEPIAKLTTHTYDHACDTTCNVCSATRKTSHSYKTTTTKATLSKNGSIVKKCTVCGHTASSTTIRYVKTITLSTTTYTYDGKTKTPSVTVKDSAGKVLTKDTDYTVSYASGRKAVGTYNVVITLKGNYSGSKTLTFTIKPAPAKVTSQPKTQKVEVGEKIKFTVGASGDGLKYQWQSSSNGKDWKNCSSSSAKKATFSFTSKTSHNGNYYRCKITDSSGNVVYTSAVRAYVLGVTTQPKTQKVESGDKIKLTVKATGDGLKYQWQSSTNGKTWKNCSSSAAKKATFSFTSKTSHNGNYYRCKVTDSAGNVVYTSAVRVYVLGIKDQPDSKTVTKGKTAKFTVEATGASVKYQWQVSTNGGKTWKNCTSSSAKKATFSFTTKTSHSGNYYRCKITDSAKNSMYTSKAKLTVKK